MKKYLRSIMALSILNLVSFVLVIFFLSQKQQPFKPKIPASVTSTITSPSVKPQNGTGTTPGVSPTSAPRDLFSELSKHNTQGDCWIAYNGHIYDISSYFGSHPGGDSLLLKYCGSDATVGFNTKDMAPGKAHSAAALSMLQQYLIQ